MSLVRLLTAGKSLVGLKESENRYRLTSQRLLPKFESKKNPFGAGVQSQLEPAVDPVPSPPAEDGVSDEAHGRSADPVSEAPGAESKPTQSPLPALPPNADGLWSRTCRWCAAGLGSFFNWRRARPAQALTRRQPKKLFQAELSLEAVRVVRNDLSDTDLEIVTCKKAAAAPKTDRAATPSGNESAPNRAWNKVADTLFGGAKR